MHRNKNGSVRDKIRAIEDKQKKSENSVIRARYVPDVRGINRYRHFYVANTTPDTDRLLMGPLERPLNKNELPVLVQTRMNGGLIVNDDNGVEKKRKRPPKTELPHLGKLSIGKVSKEKDIVDHIERQSQMAAANSSESDASGKSERSARSARGIRLNDHLTATAIHLQSGKRTFASLGVRQNGLIINRPAVNSSLDVTLPPRSKSAHEGIIHKAINFRPHANLEEVEPEPESLMDKRNIATQTIERVKKSTASVEFLDPLGCGQSTQTDPFPIVINPRRRREVVRMDDLEEREALFQVIDDALGETIDRYSRLRTNQIIANSARKQAQIWRDAKDFMAHQLFPQAIALANQSKTRRKTAAEIVANIKCYP